MTTKRGNNMIEKIICGDCLEVMKDIPDKTVSMVLCDLPYQITRCKWDSIIPFEPLWEQYNRVIKDNGAIVLTASQPFTTAMINSNFKNFCYTWIWDKKFGANFVQAKRQPLRTHEDIVIFSNNGKMPNYYPQMIDRDIPIKKGANKLDEAIPIARTETNKQYEKKVYDKKYPDTQLHYSSRENRGLHPTQKPVSLFEYLIRTYTKEGETVLDNCMGSFTTAVACDNLNRRWIGIEKEMEYCEIGLKRVNDNRVALGMDKVELIEY